ncbi:MAG TPA: serine/threonine-protein kinase [Kofleriaceae bacterium]|nr:serine/threonine-protein kinase [Kofleriaceae bacterium]
MTTTPGYETTIGVVDPTDPTAPEEPRSERRQELTRGTMVGRYQIIKMIGRGGMGAVYAAHDPNLDRQVALKLLHSTSARNDDGAERMIREAQALARLDDPHVVQVYDAGEYEDQIFITMQLVDGVDLGTAITHKKPGVPLLISWFCDAGRGLAAAHAAGLVHRDFKPNNVLIDGRGRIAVTDFGLARTLEPSDERRHLTGVNAIMGTPAYMSPEQHGQQSAGPASDQFSFCVALWEALYDRHPFIAGDRSSIASMSPFAIGYQIFDGEIILPPKQRHVPRRVHEALVRGLSRDPDKRWPSMTDLIAEIAPAQKRRIWPLVVGIGALAAAGGGVAMWLVLANDPEQASCAQQSASRVTGAWSTTAAQALQAQFAKSGRSYAEKAAQQARTGLDRYATRWQNLAADVCEAERAASGKVPELVVRRHACLDSRLDSFRGVTTMLTSEAKPEFVDRAQAILDGLPDLADCIDESLPDVPPAAIATEVAKLDTELSAVEARAIAGDYATSKDAATKILARADQLKWPPLQVRAHFVIGRVQAALLLPARDELIAAGEIANANHLDREAARAWTMAQQAAGYEQSADALATLAPIARSAAQRTNDKVLIATAEIKRARALVRMRKWQDGAAACKAAYDNALTLDKKAAVDEARDCMLESLVPLGKGDDVEKLLAQILADKTTELGADHPTISDYLKVRVGQRLRKGDLVGARKDAEQMLAIRRKTYPEKHYRIAEAIKGLSDVVAAEGKADEADKLHREALAMLDETKSEHLVLLSALLVEIATREFISGKHKEGLERFEHAAKLVRKRAGDNSLELAILLLNYGQFKASENVEAGLGLIGEAREILENNKDRRAPVAGIAAAIIANNAKRYPDVVKFLDETLPLLGPNDDPEQIATAKSLLARALVETKGDKKRARQLATDAKTTFVKLGPSFDADVKVLDKVLAKLK